MTPSLSCPYFDVVLLVHDVDSIFVVVLLLDDVDWFSKLDATRCATVLDVERPVIECLKDDRLRVIDLEVVDVTLVL